MIYLFLSAILRIALALRSFWPVWRSILIEKKLLTLNSDDHKILIRGLRSWYRLSLFLKAFDLIPRDWFKSWGFMVLKSIFWNFQDSVLSPLTSVIFINDLPEVIARLLQVYSKIIKYDTVLVFSTRRRQRHRDVASTST